MYVYFEDGPWAGQTKSIEDGRTSISVVPPVRPMTEAFSDHNAQIPGNATVQYVVYRVVAVNNHPSGCRYKAVVS